jgi:GTPase SAR1 family protein
MQINKKSDNTTDKKTDKKILVAGLDNSGKTSIILTLDGYRRLNVFQMVHATLGKERKRIIGENKNFIVWELGGQEKYRDEYLSNLEQTTSGVDKFIFVIDVQDIARYSVALLYLFRFIEHFDKNAINPEISIFLHKFDSDLESKPEFSDQKINELLISKIRQNIPTTFQLGIFKTSIFAVFEKKQIII